MDAAPAKTSVVTTAGGEKLLTVDRFVPHVSTVPANLGRTVGLHLREKVLASVVEGAARGKPRVVLFLHGGYSPSTVAYDLDYKDDSCISQLAHSGFVALPLTHTSYDACPHPI